MSKQVGSLKNDKGTSELKNNKSNEQANQKIRKKQGGNSASSEKTTSSKVKVQASRARPSSQSSKTSKNPEDKGQQEATKNKDSNNVDKSSHKSTSTKVNVQKSQSKKKDKKEQVSKTGEKNSRKATPPAPKSSKLNGQDKKIEKSQGNDSIQATQADDHQRTPVKEDVSKPEVSGEDKKEPPFFKNTVTVTSILTLEGAKAKEKKLFPKKLQTIIAPSNVMNKFYDGKYLRGFLVRQPNCPPVFIYEKFYNKQISENPELGKLKYEEGYLTRRNENVTVFAREEIYEYETGRWEVDENFIIKSRDANAEACGLSLYNDWLEDKNRMTEAQIEEMQKKMEQKTQADESDCDAADDVSAVSGTQNPIKKDKESDTSGVTACAVTAQPEQSDTHGVTASGVTAQPEQSDTHGVTASAVTTQPKQSDTSGVTASAVTAQPEQEAAGCCKKCSIWQIVCWAALVLLVIALLAAIITILAIYGPGWLAKLFPSLFGQPSESAQNTSHPASSISSNTDSHGTPTNNEPSNSTAIALTTTTKAYPPISAVPRVPVVDLSSSTYDIVSAGFKLMFNYDTSSSTPNLRITKVVFDLNVKSSTDVIRLRCAVANVTKVSMTSTDGKQTEITSKTLDTKSQVLTIKLPQPVQGGTLSLQIAYSISTKSFEKLSFPCGVKTCTFFVNRQLRFVVPHFDDRTKHQWKVEITYQDEYVNVLTNTRSNNSVDTGISTKADFHTSALLPRELSLAIIHNLDKHVYGSQVEVYLPFATKPDKVATLVDILQKALASISKVKEMFYMIVVPAMKTYQFIGRNFALVGEDLTGSNTEIKTNFVWTWIYRVMIYDKATSMDRNPTHIYEQSAVFLSTTTKSNFKDKWQKHHYGLAMDRGSSGTKGVHNQAIAFEDEKRYPEKPEHVAMLSTVLGMVTSLGNSISGDPLQNLAGDRNNALSARFFFVKSELKLANGKRLNVDKMVSCYVNSPEVSRVHISRLSSSQVAVQRSSGEQEPGCDMNLWIVKGKPNGTNNKEHIVLSTGVEKIQVESQSPVLLSGESPISAYVYSMDQAEFDKIQEALDSYDQASIKTLVLNGFRAAFDGRLTYESLKKFVTAVLSRGKVSMDEVVDMLMWTISQSHNKLTRITEAIGAMLNATGQPSDSKTVTTLIDARFQKSMKEFPLFEIEKASLMLKRCGKACYSHVVDYYDQAECWVKDGIDCSINPHALEVFVCLIITAQTDQYQKYHNLFTKCTGKACGLPTVRGLLCTSDSHNLQSWLNVSMTIDVSGMGNRQVVQAIFEGLATNEASKDMLYSYFVENFNLIYERFSQFPALLGDIIEKTGSTITNEEQLVEFKQFVGFYGNDVKMFNEFEEQIQKAEKAVKFNRELLTDFEKHFY